ncbi:tripartite motif-containing protein 2-like [Dysidea avara]|uniref:tripartite motif-containing protein 2-like n=1 Tax=Dysidea avara TaxID=196820 RepID=UPI00331717C6
MRGGMVKEPKKMTLHLTCSLCHEVYQKPKYLPCYHSYCEECLAKLLVESNVTCPKCKTICTIPSGDVKSLPNNFFINRRLHEVALQNKVARAAREEEAKCDHCAGKENLAVVLCRDCGTLLCDYCYGYHKNSKEYQNHNVTSLDELQSEGISLKASVAMCQEHDIELNFYCETCEQLVCHYCITKTHHDHDHDAVKKMAEKHRKELDKVMEPVQEMVDGLLAACKIVYDTVDEIETMTSAVEKEIDKYFEWLQQQLQQQKEELKRELHEASVQKKKELSLQQQQLEGIKVELESVKELNDTMKKGSGQDILLMRKEVIDDMKSLCDCYKKVDTEPVESPAMEFVCVKEYEESFLSFGNLRYSNTYPLSFEATEIPEFVVKKERVEFRVVARDQNNCTFQRSGSKAVVIVQSNEGHVTMAEVKSKKDDTHLASFTANHVGEVKVYVFVKGEQVKGSPYTIKVYNNYSMMGESSIVVNDSSRMGQPCGIAFGRNGIWAVSDYSNHCVWIFDSQDQLVKKFGSKGFENCQFLYPHGIAFDLSSYLYVAEHCNHRVKKFSIAGEYVLQLGSQGSGNSELMHPAGITVHGDRLYVTEITNKRISVFQCDGQFFHIIGLGHLISPHDVVINSDELLLISDMGHHCVYMFTIDGTYISKFGIPGADRGQINNPNGIAVDVSGLIFITEDANHRVSIYDKNGIFIHCFGCYGFADGQFSSPCGIALSPNGCVYVSDFHNKRIQKFFVLND